MKGEGGAMPPPRHRTSRTTGMSELQGVRIANTDMSLHGVSDSLCIGHVQLIQGNKQ